MLLSPQKHSEAHPTGTFLDLNPRLQTSPQGPKMLPLVASKNVRLVTTPFLPDFQDFLASRLFCKGPFFDPSFAIVNFCPGAVFTDERFSSSWSGSFV